MSPRSPVCSQVAGWILGTESYAEGRFPGRGRFIVQLPEASTVKVSFYLEEVSAAGEETVVLFHEDGCRSGIQAAAALGGAGARRDRSRDDRGGASRRS